MREHAAQRQALPPAAVWRRAMAPGGRQRDPAAAAQLPAVSSSRCVTWGPFSVCVCPSLADSALFKLTMPKKSQQHECRMLWWALRHRLVACMECECFCMGHMIVDGIMHAGPAWMSKLEPRVSLGVTALMGAGEDRANAMAIGRRRNTHKGRNITPEAALAASLILDEVAKVPR